MTWQPIDTAPKDGTEILASDYDAIEIVSWAEPRFNLIPGNWVGRDGCVMLPAWWQPLPDHPPLPATPKPNIVPKPQFPPHRVILGDFP